MFISFSQQVFSLLKGRVCVLKDTFEASASCWDITNSILPVFSGQISCVESLMGNLPLNTALVRESSVIFNSTNWGVRKRSNSDFQFMQKATNECKGAQ